MRQRSNGVTEPVLRNRGNLRGKEQEFLAVEGDFRSQPLHAGIGERRGLAKGDHDARRQLIEVWALDVNDVWEVLLWLG